ncbi:MAG: hypothetical protein WBW73_07525 [Rhodoplanes sp.]
MSCGSTNCTSTDFPRHIETAKRPLWLSRALGVLGAILDRERRRQLSFELEKARQRGLLKDLDDRMFADIGITREQANREARKPFWK